MAEENAGLYYPDGSYQSRRDIIRKSFLNGAHFEPRFETPLPVDKDFDYWSDRMQRRQTEALSTEEERQHVRVGLEHRSLVSFIGDIHAGNAHTDYARVEAEVKAIVETPNSYAILMGDLIDNFFWSPPIHEADSPVPDQIEYAWSIIRRLGEKKKLLAGWTGNHCDTWGKKGGNTMYKRFSRDTGAYLMSGLGFCDITVGDTEYKLAGAHQLLGFSMYNANHPQQRALRMGGAWGADIVVSAHTHAKSLQVVPVQEYGFQSKRVHYINVGTYKWTDGFIKDKGFGDKAKNGEPSEMLYGCSVVLNRDTKTIEPFFDIMEAHKAFIRSTEP